jgi:hypothetical protein
VGLLVAEGVSLDVAFGEELEHATRIASNTTEPYLLRAM